MVSGLFKESLAPWMSHRSREGDKKEAIFGGMPWLRARKDAILTEQLFILYTIAIL